MTFYRVLSKCQDPERSLIMRTWRCGPGPGSAARAWLWTRAWVWAQAGPATIAAAGRGPHLELLQSGGEQADRPFQALHPAVHEQRVSLHRQAAVPGPHPRRADHVGHAGLVLQAQEHHPPRRPRLLPV